MPRRTAYDVELIFTSGTAKYVGPLPATTELVINVTTAAAGQTVSFLVEGSDDNVTFSTKTLTYVIDGDDGTGEVNFTIGGNDPLNKKYIRITATESGGTWLYGMRLAA